MPLGQNQSFAKLHSTNLGQPGNIFMDYFCLYTYKISIL